MKISDNFDLEEFINSATAKKYKIDNSPNDEIVKNIKTLVINVLQPIRNQWGKPIKVTSGYRCKTLNDKVKGSKTSQHLTGDAADITVGSPSENKKLFHLIVDMYYKKDVDFGQLIDEYDFKWLHISNLRKGKPNHQILHLK